MGAVRPVLSAPSMRSQAPRTTRQRRGLARVLDPRTLTPPSIPLSAAADPLVAARVAGLRYVQDDTPGIRREGRGPRVRYVDPQGQRVRSVAELARIRALAIPPAWTAVWICPRADGHLQATGRDARGRKQYRYHARWREVRDETKYDRMLAFGRALPGLRRRVDEALALPGLPREKVLATIVRLLELTLIRVGNEEYARDNDSFGLTTLRNRHARVAGDRVHFGFRGKSGVRHAIDVRDKRLARVVKRCRELPGYELFSYLDDEGVARSVDSADVNEWLREVAGEGFTAKDFRTWAGTVLAAGALCAAGGFASEAEARRNVLDAVGAVAAKLGNTRAVCRKCYVHPGVIEGYLDGTLAGSLCDRARALSGRRRDEHALTAREEALMEFLAERASSAMSARRAA